MPYVKRSDVDITTKVLLVLFFPLVSCAASAQPITIISPNEGSSVRPGQSVQFQVRVDPSLLPANVTIGSRIFLRIPAAVTLTGGPDYIGSLDIPIEASGPLPLDIDLIRPNGGGGIPGTGTTITLNVIPDETPLRLDVDGSIFLSPTPTGGFESKKLSVDGIYTNEIERDLTLPMLGTTYRSSNETVVTVDVNGRVQGVSIGTAFVTVENRGIRAYSQIAVRGPNGAYPPPQDITSKVSITESGFRLDPETRLYVQQLTIRNTSNEPIFNPLGMVISDLPEGVRLENSGTRTRVITPLKSGTASLTSGGLIPPGATATATLKFSNRDGRPITHTVRLFHGAHL